MSSSDDGTLATRVRVTEELNERVAWAYFYFAARDFRTGEVGLCGWPTYDGDTAPSRARANLERLRLPPSKRPERLEGPRGHDLIDALLAAMEPYCFLTSAQEAAGYDRTEPQEYRPCPREEARRRMDFAYEVDGPWETGPEPFRLRMDEFFASFPDADTVFLLPADRVTDSVIDTAVLAWEPSRLRLSLLCYQNDQ